ncbi:hypothetical protein GCM10007973_31160 [Polymorphobacter multimanifer]|uniref:DUF4160 domain-containing protein n=1 Tax=Polymorphobacter multimanifer TaxID=1070431 RepID=A0A841L9S3_9SPHN|nr:DUF4160 domain-containing protein [Polymorphobacter multimanifer]MBB6229180.1 hypothetical protein [Polymorphobacter multimanifer]GGI92620.1 hypothetical protein GCM10007973_31160 [Polymorphobacter multimanifer]
MPELFREGGLRYFFYANEGSPREPVHVHVRRGREEAKFWLRPLVSLSYNDGLSARELREAGQVVLRERERIERAWNDFFA